MLNYYVPLREQIHKAIEAGFIREENFSLVTFVDGPVDLSEHITFDWGSAIVRVLDEWKPSEWKGFGFAWNKKADGTTATLEAT